MSEIYLLWYKGDGMAARWWLFGAFLTDTVARRRLDQLTKEQPDRSWCLTCRQIGELRDEVWDSV